jgi:large subunit ribosomal protein L4e
VLARGHRISQVPQIPLVVEDKIESYEKTKDALNFLKRFGAFEDV